MASQARWLIKYRSDTFEFDANTDLTAARLRSMKSWFGQQYGQWTQVVNMLILGDADAWSSAVWICLKRDGQKVPANPTFLDFPVGQFMDDLEPIASDDDESDGAEEGPTEDGVTPDSDRTSTPSEDVISGS